MPQKQSPSFQQSTFTSICPLTLLGSATRCHCEFWNITSHSYVINYGHWICNRSPGNLHCSKSQTTSALRLLLDNTPYSRRCHVNPLNPDLLLWICTHDPGLPAATSSSTRRCFQIPVGYPRICRISPSQKSSKSL